MRHVRLACLTLLSVLAVFSTPAARASPIAYEGFPFPAPAPFNGGVGFNGPWAGSGYTWSDATLSLNGFAASGGSVTSDASIFGGGSAFRPLAPGAAFFPTIYVSFLVQPHGRIAPDVFSFFGLYLSGTTADTLVIGKPGAGAADQWVLENFGGLGQVASGVQAVVGETALLVVKAQFQAGNDVFTLYVNPSPKGGEPASGAVKSDLDLGSLFGLGIISAGASAIDEIRVGTTWADVVVPSK